MFFIRPLIGTIIRNRLNFSITKARCLQIHKNAHKYRDSCKDNPPYPNLEDENNDIFQKLNQDKQKNENEDKKEDQQKNKINILEYLENFSKKYGYYGLGILAGFFILKFSFQSIVHGKSIQSDDVENQNEKQSKRKAFFKDMNFIADIVEEVSPSVVFLSCSVQVPWIPARAANSGSGFVIDTEDGIILTNAHVVANSRDIIVRFNNMEACKGVVEFVDDRLDLATVRVPTKVLKNLRPLKLAKNRSRAGEWVIAVGAPFTLSNTVTVGVISSISRRARELGLKDNIDYIQTDASINIGNSGGPLMDLNGDVVGINTLKVGEGVSFAVPAYYVQKFLEQCSSVRHANRKSSQQNNNVAIPNRRYYLGITMITLTPSLMETVRSSNRDFPEVNSGVLIYKIVIGSPAHKSGLHVDDIIMAINGKPIQGTDDVYRALEMYNELDIRVRRKNEELTVKVRPEIAN